MSRFEDRLCYYAYLMDPNFGEFKKINVLANHWVREWLNKYLKKNFVTFELFVKELDTKLKCEFSGRAEYEFLAGDLFEKTKMYKVCVYDQLKSNMEIIAKYIIDTWNSTKRESNRIDI